MQDTVGQDVQTVVFRLGEQEYGIDIFKVQEIIKIPKITGLPNTADYVKGIINLRGCIIPVIDLKSRFTKSESVYCEDSRVIVVEMNAKRTGLIVDEVMEVVRINGNMVEQDGFTQNGTGADYLMGIAKMGDRLLILLDINALLN
ncbi:MAG TPA: chemotaxis protein CheW [Syntrophomonadaceae bacterium]|nr:chemotaxis protein CheW [Syntrophomonadaceae bacterium]